jgi:hypothetical protein
MEIAMWCGPSIYAHETAAVQGRPECGSRRGSDRYQHARPNHPPAGIATPAGLQTISTNLYWSAKQTSPVIVETYD